MLMNGARNVLRRNRLLGWFVCALLLAVNSTAVAGTKTWGDISNAGRTVLAVAALGAPLIQKDTPGLLQAGASMGAAELVALGLKESFPETRPDGSDRKSFPSGHAALSFAGAATLQNRYGWKAGLPAQLLAAFVGFARVKADKHHWYDVVAGAAIGEASGFLITSKHDDDVRVTPWADGSGGGVQLVARF